MAKKILVIDDEEELLEALDTVLTDNGYEMIGAKSGPEGLTIAKEQAPDLVVLDIAMPKMDGLEVLSKLKGSRQTSTIPVLMLTAKGSTDNIMQADRHRAVEFIIKPVPTDEFLSIVHRCVR